MLVTEILVSQSRVFVDYMTDRYATFRVPLDALETWISAEKHPPRRNATLK